MTDAIARRRTFAKKNHLTIAFTAIADFSSFIGQEYLAGIMQAATDYGVNFINMASAVRHSLFLDTDFLPQYLSKLQFMKKPLIDGLVTWASTLCNVMPNEKVQKLFTSLQPLPMVDIGYLDIPGIPSIRIDNTYSMHLLVQHLKKTHAFSRIAFMGAKLSVPHERRRQNFLAEMEKHHLSCSDEDIFMADSLDEKDIEFQTERLIAHYGLKAHEKSKNLDAVITSSDIIASTLITALEKHHISVPDDLAVTGFNNQLKGITAPCPVTTINLSYFNRGYEAVELLLDRIQSPAAHVSHRTVKTQLIVRQSCGCFEKSIVSALSSGASLEPAQRASPEEISKRLFSILLEIFSQEKKDDIASLVTAVQNDLQDNTPPHQFSHILVWFRSLHKSGRKYDWEEKITAFRKVLLFAAQGDAEKTRSMEDICNALRVMHALSTQYQMTAHQSDSFLSNMTNIALSLASASDTEQLENVLRLRLSELHIPGIILCLSPFMSSDLGSANLELIVPEPPDDIVKSLPVKIREPALFPKRLLPHSSPLQLTLELLFHNGMYLGWCYLFMGNVNLTLYDNVKELLSQTLYNIYLKEGKTKSHALVITNREELTKNIINIEEPLPVRYSKLNAKALADYLLDHLDEMTDLDKMAAFFGMSKSHLVRRSRELTGYSVQVLHERFKIEQAKDLIKSGKMKMRDIAGRLGFSNPNYFSSVFKKETGLSPLAWAQRNRINQ